MNLYRFHGYCNWCKHVDWNISVWLRREENLGVLIPKCYLIRMSLQVVIWYWKIWPIFISHKSQTKKNNLYNSRMKSAKSLGSHSRKGNICVERKINVCDDIIYWPSSRCDGKAWSWSKGAVKGKSSFGLCSVDRIWTEWTVCHRSWAWH